tara:strand:+ start:197 stop:490 length:294 start_codon:yes stop_codon:yes gene_type:complete
VVKWLFGRFANEKGFYSEIFICISDFADFWPISLGFNASQPPFDNPGIRRAINFAIDRDQLFEIAWQGAGKSTLLPFSGISWLRALFQANGRIAGQI